MWCSSSNTTANKMPLLCWGWIWVIMCNLPSLYLRCRLTARCEGMSEVAGKGFSAAFEVHGGIDKPCSETWAGMKTSWNNQTLQTRSVCLFSDVILLMLALYTVLHISLYLEQCDKDRSAKKRRKEKKKKKKAEDKSKMSVSQRRRFFLPLPNTCKNAFAHLLCSLHLSVVRCNTWVSRKHESSWGKCLLICFRYCFIAVSSLTSSVKLPPHTEGSLYLTGIPQAQISKQH